MFAEWVTNGVGIRVQIFFAGFTVLVSVGAILGLMGLAAKFLRGIEDGKEADD